uniref:Uncharacterized protein n=1 Tax=Phaseolus vulgaris TaxID=3885 RepID=V7CGQ0_PHAVU|nr:hypothetical protein PHAVU_003G294600g [Phaseolus vulgaris]ESW28533.1 hypothetical protein PHAVU_003G294600g [Phaseolus vulgaris]
MALNGTVIGKQTVRLSCVAVQWRSDSNGGHYGGEGYGGHGFAVTQSGSSHATCCCCNSRGFLICKLLLVAKSPSIC